ncbi:hypothetical protein LWI29_034620 [Acer saccharum]|uniref:CG-1 domain-containing protein n=1 Tax=Acer saccharum TaxID=4024 RepID=A0AA39SPJ2_ACESA|nr:hypothetical protein LWI29_034620 [Acer saccharum]
MRSTNSTRRRLKSHLVDLCFYLTRGYFGFFCKDGHNWCKKKDGRAVGEAHEILKGKPTSSSVAVSPEAGASSTSSSSPGSVEVSSEIVIKDNSVDIIGEFIGCDDVKTSQALRRLEIDSLPNQYFEYKGGISKQEQYDALLQIPEYTIQEQYNGGHPGFQDRSSNILLHDDAVIQLIWVNFDLTVKKLKGSVLLQSYSNKFLCSFVEWPIMLLLRLADFSRRLMSINTECRFNLKEGLLVYQHCCFVLSTGEKSKVVD